MIEPILTIDNPQLFGFTRAHLYPQLQYSYRIWLEGREFRPLQSWHQVISNHCGAEVQLYKENEITSIKLHGLPAMEWGYWACPLRDEQKPWLLVYPQHWLNPDFQPSVRWEATQ